jgi:ABC-type multidrug transport system ATPase subunit/ABC-type multidrug transport system permease subunit
MEWLSWLALVCRTRRSVRSFPGFDSEREKEYRTRTKTDCAIKRRQTPLSNELVRCLLTVFEMSTAQTTTAMEDVESGDGTGNYGNEIADDSNNNNPRVLDRDDSELDKHDDPFAPREGKTLTWTNIHMTLAGKGEESERKLLDNVWGEVPEKQTTAVMGPSGAGKTSLLNILAGRASSHGRVKIESDVRLNNYSVDPTNIKVRKLIAFVAQDDSLQVTSTPREAIRFSAKLRLPRATTDHQLDKLTDRMITELGLTACADSIVGGELIKGISGGERKRTSVGVELVVKPALVFLDEPTSGLDSFSAVQLCQVLKKVANAGSSVLFTIHQPSSEIFNSFDHLILMNKGRVMYTGSVHGVPDFFASRGHPNPPNYNPADFIMNVAQSVPIKQLNEDGFFPTDERKMGEAFVPDDGQDALGITVTRRTARGVDVYDTKPPGLVTQVKLLFTREINNLRRDVTALGARFGLTIFLGVLVGIIFLDVGKTDPTVAVNLQSHFGALIMVLLMSMFGTAQPALLSFPEERPVFLREYSTNHYSVISYFLSRLTMEAVVTGLQVFVQAIITYFMIGFQLSFGLFWAVTYSLAMASTALAVLLGCSVEDPKLAQEMLPILFVPQMLFAGFFVVPDLIRKWSVLSCAKMAVPPCLYRPIFGTTV